MKEGRERGERKEGKRGEGRKYRYVEEGMSVRKVYEGR